MKTFTILSFAILFASQSQAKIWRVNNNLGIAADFTDISAAVTAAAAGDTIMVEASASSYSGITLTKKLIIIGTGYYLTENNPAIPNPKTQANTYPSTISGNATFNLGSAGSIIEGFGISNIYLNDSVITIQRNHIKGWIFIGETANSVCNNDTIRQNVMVGMLGRTASSTASNLLVYNNLYNGSIDFSANLNHISGYFINNVFIQNNNYSCANFTFQNNIFNYGNFGAYQSSNIFFNNITNIAFSATGIPAGNSNQQNVDFTTVFNGWSQIDGFSSDGRYMLKEGSPAIGAGKINGVTVDCGAFGGPAPYVLSGMPSIPSVYSLTIPAQVPSGTGTINISLSSTTVH